MAEEQHQEVLSNEEKQKIIADELLREKVRAEHREKEKAQEKRNLIETSVKESAVTYSNTIVGLEGQLEKETIDCGIDHDEVLMYLKEGLNRFIQYNIEVKTLNPGKTDLFDEWLKHNSTEYNEGFKVLDNIMDDINPYMEKGIALVRKIRDAKVLDKLSESKSNEALINAYDFSFTAVIEMLNKIILDPFRRSATYQKDMLEKRIETVALLENEWKDYAKNFIRKPDKQAPEKQEPATAVKNDGKSGPSMYG